MSEIKISNTFKIILVGESNVGKTSIISRYTKDEFRINNLSTIATSVSDKIINLNDKNIKLQIWDTAGQEKYRAISEIFFKNSDAVIFVYDITSKISFDEIVNFWYNYVIKDQTSDVISALAANKADLFDKEEVNEDEGRNFAEEKNLIFYLTSACNRTGIDNLFKDIVDRLCERKVLKKKENNGTKLNAKNTEKNKNKKCC